MLKKYMTLEYSAVVADETCQAARDWFLLKMYDMVEFYDNDDPLKKIWLNAINKEVNRRRLMNDNSNQTVH